MNATATAATPATEKKLTPHFALSERELEKYSLSRAILTSSENQEGGLEKNCFELEVSEEILKTVTGGTRGGICIPWNLPAGNFARRLEKIRQRAGLDTATSTKGTELKFTGLIDGQPITDPNAETLGPLTRRIAACAEGLPHAGAERRSAAGLACNGLTPKRLTCKTAEGICSFV